MMRFFPRLLAFSALGCAVTLSPWAQTVIPGSAQPGRLDQQMKVTPPPPSVELSVPEAPQNIAPDNAAQVTFVLKGVTVEGSTVYSGGDLRPYYAKYIGQKISLGDIYAIADILTEKYRADGYVLSQVIVPPQSVDDGQIKLRVVEGFIHQVVITPEESGATLQKSKRLEDMGKQLVGLHPLTRQALERQLLLMNDLPGVQVKGVIKAAEHVVGAADLYLVVSRKKFDGSVGMSNRGSRYLGPIQAQSALNINGIFDENDSASAQFAVTAETKEMQFFDVAYQRQLMANGLSMKVEASHGVTHPGASLEAFDVFGKTTNYSAQIEYPWLRSRAKNISFYSELEAKDAESKILGARNSKDRIRALRFGSNITSNDKWLGSNTANIELSKGLTFLGASDHYDPITRPRANIAFTKLNATLSREQLLRDSNFSLFGAASGQYSGSALQAGEEFGIGGEAFGSAYEPSELTGDSGIAGRMEGRYLYITGMEYLPVAQPYVFYDVGMVHNRDPGTGLPKRSTLSDAGFGVRVVAAQGFSGSFEVADPISRPVTNVGNTRDPRFFFKVQKTF